MNTMQDFYTTISSKEKLKDAYLKILADLTKLDRAQMSVLESDMAWQDWGAEKPTQIQTQA